MPTNQRYWNGTETVSDAALLAKFTVWTSTNTECANEAFNFINGDHFSWRYMWPRLAEWCGAYATSDQHFEKSEPDMGQLQQDFSLVEWAKDKQPVWDSLCDRMGVPEAKESFQAGTFASRDRAFMRSWSSSLSMNKAKKFGWTDSVDSFDSWIDAFAKFAELRQIPRV